MKNETYTSGNSQLLQDYRKVLITAYELGEDIKKLYGIIPPKAITDIEWKSITVGLTIN